MSMQERAPFGPALRRYRLAAGLSQELLAERAGLSARTVSDLERGVAAQPRLETVQLLTTALALPPQERAALLAAARPAPAPTRTHGATPPLPAALTPLIGRDRELALLAQVLVGPGEPGPATPLLLLAGEPGIGKTRLLQAATQQAIGQGWAVLAGGCHRHGGQEPYAPLLDALAQHLHALPPEHQQTALAGCAWLVRLLPELAGALEPLPGGTVPPEQERRLLFAAVARVLGNVAGPAGTLLVLDDLQWAGPDALDLLAALVHAPAPAAPLRVVGAYRDTEMRPDDPFGLLLADLAQAGLARHHTLGPLAPDGAAELLADLLGGRAADGADPSTASRVLARAGGTPFYLVSYAQALRTGRAAAVEGTDAVPWDLVQGVRQRVALLPETARQLLGAAAIVGRRAPRALLVAAARLPDDAVLEGLEAACQARLLLEDGDDAYTFTHDVIREVVEADVGAARRALLHRRVAEALECNSTGASPELLAYHYTRGGHVDKAAPYLEQAGDQAWAQRAHGAAERHYRETLDRLEALGRVTDTLRVREKLGEVLYRAGRFDAAIQVLEPAADAFRAAGAWAGLGRVTARIGWAHSLQGTPHEGVTRLTTLLEFLDRTDASPPPAMLYGALGHLLFAAGRYGESLATSERVAARARAEGDERTWVLAHEHRMNLLQMLGRLGDALRVGQEMLPLAEAVGDQDGLLWAHRDLAYIHALQGAVALGRAAIERALAVAEQMRDPGQLSFTLTIRGWIALLGGDWRDARADLERALAWSRQVDGAVFAAYALFLLARLSLAQGDWAEASASGEEALALAERSGDLQALRWATSTMAEIDILEGRPEVAGARLAALLDRPGLEECDVTMLLPVLAWAYLEQVQLEQATQVVEQGLVRARREEMRLVLVDALRVQALIALRQERWDEATRSLEEGVALARSMPYPYAEARLLHLHGKMLSLRDRWKEPTPAREHLEAALTLFTRLGAHADAARVEEALAALSQKQETCETPLTDAQWAQIAALLPPRRRGRGRPRADDRRTLDAILYVQRTGCAWADLPAALGDEATAHRRWRAWQADGLWERIAAIAWTPPSAGCEHMHTAGAGASAAS